MEMQNMNNRVKVRGMNGAGFGIIQLCNPKLPNENKMEG